MKINYGLRREFFRYSRRMKISKFFNETIRFIFELKLSRFVLQNVIKMLEDYAKEFNNLSV